LATTLDSSSSPCEFIYERAKDFEPWQLDFLKSTIALMQDFGEGFGIRPLGKVGA
jgi:hypothetical protein